MPNFKSTGPSMVFNGMERIHKILVVEDNPDDALLIQEAFSECGYRCQLTIVDSLSRVENLIGAEEFHVILCDYCGDPDEALRLIRVVKQRKPFVPVIVLSSYSDPHPAYEARANAFVHKTNDRERFFKNIQHIMRFWTEAAESPLLPLRER